MSTGICIGKPSKVTRWAERKFTCNAHDHYNIILYYVIQPRWLIMQYYSFEKKKYSKNRVQYVYSFCWLFYYYYYYFNGVSINEKNNTRSNYLSTFSNKNRIWVHMLFLGSRDTDVRCSYYVQNIIYVIWTFKNSKIDRQTIILYVCVVIFFTFCEMNNNPKQTFQQLTLLRTYLIKIS